MATIPLSRISVNMAPYIQAYGAAPSGRERNIYVWHIGNYEECYYKSSFSKQLKIAKQQAQSYGVSSITLVSKLY